MNYIRPVNNLTTT